MRVPVRSDDIDIDAWFFVVEKGTGSWAFRPTLLRHPVFLRRQLGDRSFCFLVGCHGFLLRIPATEDGYSTRRCPIRCDYSFDVTTGMRDGAAHSLWHACAVATP